MPCSGTGWLPARFGSLTLATFGVVPASAVGSTASDARGSAAVVAQDSPEMSSNTFESLYYALDKLPEELKEADPATYPGYVQKLDQELSKIDPSLGAQGPGSSSVSGAMPSITWVSCGAAVAGAVAQYGIPVAKVIGWLKDAVKIYKSLKTVWELIRKGAPLTELGGEATDALAGILGIPGVIEACS